MEPITVRAGGELNLRHGTRSALPPQPGKLHRFGADGKAPGMRLAGKTALITAARGIGFEFARAYIAEGATVALADINAEAVARAAADLGPRLDN